MSGDFIKPATVTRIVAAILVASVGFAIGYVAAPRGATQGDSGLSGQSSLPRSEASASGPSELLPPNGERLSAPEIEIKIQRALTLPNHGDRIRALTDLLLRVDAANWRPLLDTLIPQLERNGKAHSYEWRLVLLRAGECAGAVAVDEFMPAKDERVSMRCRSVLAGWATANPEAAIEWFKLRRPEHQRGLLTGLVDGVSRSDPARAFSLLAPVIDGSQWFSGVPTTFDAAIQAGGLRAADDLYRWALNQPNFHHQFLNRALSDLTQRRLEVHGGADSPAAILNWFSSYFPVDSRYQGGEDIGKNVISTAAQLDGPVTLQWLDAQAARLDNNLSTRSYTTLATEWQAGRLDQFIAWVAANPDHPQHATIARAGVKALLIRDNPAQARAMAESVRDGDSRRQLAALISEAEAKPTTRNAAKGP